MNTITLSAAFERTYPFAHNDSAPEHPRVAAKLEELRARTISYNRELARLARELNELRAATASPQNC